MVSLNILKTTFPNYQIFKDDCLTNHKMQLFIICLKMIVYTSQVMQLMIIPMLF